MTQQPMNFDDLESSLYLGLLALPRHLQMALIGGKARRRRDDGLMPEFVDVYLKRLCQSYDFYREDALVERAELKAFFLAWFRAVPDAEAEACGGKSTLVSEPARKKVTADLYDAITSLWRHVYNPKLSNVSSRGF